MLSVWRRLHQKWPFVLQDTVHWIIADELVSAASQQRRFIQSGRCASASPKKCTSESAHLKLMALYERGVIARAVSDANDLQ